MLGTRRLFDTTLQIPTTSSKDIIHVENEISFTKFMQMAQTAYQLLFARYNLLEVFEKPNLTGLYKSGDPSLLIEIPDLTFDQAAKEDCGHKLKANPIYQIAEMLSQDPRTSALWICGTESFRYCGQKSGPFAILVYKKLLNSGNYLNRIGYVFSNHQIPDYSDIPMLCSKTNLALYFTRGKIRISNIILLAKR